MKLIKLVYVDKRNYFSCYKKTIYNKQIFNKIKSENIQNLSPMFKYILID